MRKMFTTKRLLGPAACAALLFAAAAPTPAQTADQAVNEEPLFESDAPDPDGNQVAVGETGEIELHVKELEITKVLQLLSIQSQRNIIASRGVENAKVSADLYGVSFEDALQAILEPNGFGYVEEGNFIYVLTKEELAQRESANRKMVTRVHRLDYLRADEAAGFVTPMLSDAGAITASGNVEDGISPGLDSAGADNYSGPPTLVIRDYEDSVDAIVQTLDELDVQPKQVIIEATVLRANLTENNQFGVDFSLFHDLSASSPLNAIDALTGSSGREAGITSQQGFEAGDKSSTKIGFISGDAAIFVSALDDVTDTTLIATPKVTVLDRNRTSILVGEKIAYLSTTVTETSETQTVEFLEVGTQLNVRPFVASDGKIRLELRPSVSDATIRTIGTTDAPDESTVELTTNVIVDSGQTIVLGGLFTDDTSVSRKQVPGLGSVPLIGKAFQGQDDTVNRSEVIFLVKATVDESNMLANKLGDEGMDRVNTARLAERNNLLPWSRDKLTSAHLVKARKHYDEAQNLTGEAREKKMKRARFCVDMALHMNPSMVDALRLKQQITGEAAYIKYEESIVNDVYDKVLEQEMKAIGVPALPELPEDADEDEQQAPGANADEAPGDEQAAATQGEAQDTAAVDAHGEAQADAQADAQSEADAAWLERMRGEVLGEGQADAPPATEAQAAEAEASEATAEVTEPDASDATQAKAESSDEPTWLELATAELLEEGEADASADASQEQADAENTTETETDGETAADAEAEGDNATAEVKTETD